MDKKYWDKLANNFEHDVFEVFKHDTNGLIARAIQTYGGTDKVACDLGCGVGSLLPRLSDSFGEVVAIDISPKCLQKAAKKYSRYSNITYVDQDLSLKEQPLKEQSSGERPLGKPSSRNTELPKSDFSVCVNALIFPSLTGRINFLNSGVNALNKNGVLLLVVPSLESALLRNHREIEWNIKSGEKPLSAQKENFAGIDGVPAKKLSLGIINIDGVKTKHFLKEEIYLMLINRGLTILDISKVEYAWNTEFFDPPKWMQAPYPWDWFVVAKKN